MLIAGTGLLASPIVTTIYQKGAEAYYYCYEKTNTGAPASPPEIGTLVYYKDLHGSDGLF